LYTEAIVIDNDIEISSDWDMFCPLAHEPASTVVYADIERRLSADMIRSIIDDVDSTCTRDYRNLSTCSTGTYYYDAMTGEWIDDDGDTIYQSFMDQDSMALYDKDIGQQDHALTFFDNLQQSGLIVDDGAEMDLSILVGEEYIDELDTNLEEFCEQLSMEFDEMSNLVLGRKFQLHQYS
jgi:frataxin-like iron-binding protein CyaY